MLRSACWLTLLLPAALGAQAVLEGVVLARAGDSSTPVADCALYVASNRGYLTAVRTDEKGRFTVAFTPDPQVGLQPMCPGHRPIGVNGHEGRVAFDCSQPGLCAQVEVHVAPLSVIEGHVVNDRGEPVEGARVVVRGIGPGRRGGGGETDDRGYFRLHSMAPGRYDLTVNVRRDYPAPVWVADPVSVTVGPGETVTGVQIPVRIARTIAFQGRVVGLPEGIEFIEVTRVQQGGGSSSQLRVPVNPDGTFQLDDVVAGRYQVYTQIPTKSEEQFRSFEMRGIGDMTVSEGGSATLQVARPARVHGRVSLDEALAGADPVFIQIVPAEGEGSFASSRISPEGAFDLPVVSPGRYSVNVTRGRTRIQTRDAQGVLTPLEELQVSEGQVLTLDLHAEPIPSGRLTIFVRPPPGQEPAGHYSIGIRADGRAMVAVTDQHGRFISDHVPPGEFEIAAWPRLTTEQANQPETWERAGDAVRRFEQSGSDDVEITLTAVPCPQESCLP